MNACPKCLRRSKDSAMLLEDTDCSIEPGTTVFHILGLHDKFTFTCSFLLVILSIWGVMSREIAGPRPPDWSRNSAIPTPRVVYGRVREGDGLYDHIPGEFSANLSGWYSASQQVLLLKACPSCTLQKQALQSAQEIQAAATNEAPSPMCFVQIHEHKTFIRN